ncbi:hypothetical protein RFI_18317 [Reticulomyxa filosa]|uniref:Uncharacterized protein n=1 Tax=Reticulomyxa filosa TaxID=46433 RepID=X6MZN6_RETFI|nr:hypothetical protein RFI_18317 [Reticulomyxa filosa]|eukprot:ETO18929.1 hypothetical protein RFI_18317 [Reticulomyxa filosa]
MPVLKYTSKKELNWFEGKRIDSLPLVQKAHKAIRRRNANRDSEAKKYVLTKSRQRMCAKRKKREKETSWQWQRRCHQHGQRQRQRQRKIKMKRMNRIEKSNSKLRITLSYRKAQTFFHSSSRCKSKKKKWDGVHQYYWIQCRKKWSVLTEQQCGHELRKQIQRIPLSIIRTFTRSKQMSKKSCFSLARANVPLASHAFARRRRHHSHLQSFQENASVAIKQSTHVMEILPSANEETTNMFQLKEEHHEEENKKHIKNEKKKKRDEINSVNIDINCSFTEHSSEKQQRKKRSNKVVSNIGTIEEKCTDKQHCQKRRRRKKCEKSDLMPSKSSNVFVDDAIAIGNDQANQQQQQQYKRGKQKKKKQRMERKHIQDKHCKEQQQVLEAAVNKRIKEQQQQQRQWRWDKRTLQEWIQEICKEHPHLQWNSRAKFMAKQFLQIKLKEQRLKDTTTKARSADSAVSTSVGSVPMREETKIQTCRTLTTYNKTYKQHTKWTCQRIEKTRLHPRPSPSTAQWIRHTKHVVTRVSDIQIRSATDTLSPNQCPSVTHKNQPNKATKTKSPNTQSDPSQTNSTRQHTFASRIKSFNLSMYFQTNKLISIYNPHIYVYIHIYFIIIIIIIVIIHLFIHTPLQKKKKKKKYEQFKENLSTYLRKTIIQLPTTTQTKLKCVALKCFIVDKISNIVCCYIKQNMMNLIPASNFGAELMVRAIFFGQTIGWFTEQRQLLCKHDSHKNSGVAHTPTTDATHQHGIQSSCFASEHSFDAAIGSSFQSFRFCFFFFFFAREEGEGALEKKKYIYTYMSVHTRKRKLKSMTESEEICTSQDAKRSMLPFPDSSTDVEATAEDPQVSEQKQKEDDKAVGMGSDESPVCAMKRPRRSHNETAKTPMLTIPKHLFSMQSASYSISGQTGSWRIQFFKSMFDSVTYMYMHIYLIKLKKKKKNIIKNKKNNNNNE